jgi:hypothetical protein
MKDLKKKKNLVERLRLGNRKFRNLDDFGEEFLVTAIELENKRSRGKEYIR